MGHTRTLIHDGLIGSRGLHPSPDHPREKGNAYLKATGHVAVLFAV
jgi:hypothetical protein